MDIRVKKSGRGEMWLMATYDDKVMGRLGEGIKAECCECTRKMKIPTRSVSPRNYRY